MSVGERRDPVGIVGCGTMGSGIAEASALAGHEVVVLVLDDEHEARGRELIGESLRRSVEANRLTDEEREAALARIAFATEAGALASAGIVIEAVPERLDTKRAVFEEIGRAAPEAVLATNTSSLPVIRVAAAAGDPGRVVGLHFFNPAPAMRVVELALSIATNAGVAARARAFAEELGKTVVECRDRAGFIANLLLFPYLNDAVRLLDQGSASRDDIDAAMRLGAGHPMGPLELVDLIGLDACLEILESLHQQFAEPRFAPAPALRELVVAGFTGRKAGRGFYDHAGEVRPPSVAGGGSETGGGEPRTVGVVGTGTVGAGIAEVAARAGLAVTCWGRSEDSVGRARAAVVRSAARAVERGKLEPEARDDLLSRIRFTTRLEDLSSCDVVVEAVAEDLEVKRDLFARLGAVASPSAVLATATSSLPVVEMAAASGRPDRVVGFHVFNPVPVMRLVEVVRTAATSDDTASAAEALARRIGKTVVRCRDRAGFIVNRLLFPYLNDAARMVEERYASVEDIDTVMTLGCRHPVGPLALMDIVGLDVTVEILRSLHRELHEPAHAPVPLLEQMVGAGFLGRKAGRGFRTEEAGRGA